MQNTISLLLCSPIRVFVRSEDDTTDPGCEMSLGAYAQQVFDVFGQEPDAETIALLQSVPASEDVGVVIGPDFVCLVDDSEEA